MDAAEHNIHKRLGLRSSYARLWTGTIRDKTKKVAARQTMLGPVGLHVVTRLLGMLLAALSVQFVIDGIRDLQVF